jgi:hypothetical protein
MKNHLSATRWFFIIWIEGLQTTWSTFVEKENKKEQKQENQMG